MTSITAQPAKSSDLCEERRLGGIILFDQCGETTPGAGDKYDTPRAGTDRLNALLEDEEEQRQMVWRRREGGHQRHIEFHRPRYDFTV